MKFVRNNLEDDIIKPILTKEVIIIIIFLSDSVQPTNALGDRKLKMVSSKGTLHITCHDRTLNKISRIHTNISTG